MRTFKDSGLSWIPQIPENWTINRLKVLFQYSKGLGITKEDLIDEGIPVISYGQVHSKDNNGTDHNPALEKFVAETYLDTDADCLVNKGDFIFADTSEDLEGCGNCAYISEQKTLFAGYHTIVLSSQCGNDNKYLAYLFKSDIWRSQIRKNVNCVKVYSVTKSILNNVTVILPPLEEQQQIVSYLDARCSKIDGAIAQRKAIIEKLKEYKSAVITKAVTKGLNPDIEMKDSGFKLIGDIPKHWEITRLKFLMIEGKSKIRVGPFGTQLTNKDLVSSGYWVYTQRTVLDKNFVDNDSFIDKEKFEDLSSFAVYPKDILVTTRGTIGRICIVPPNSPKGVLHPCLIRFRANQDKILYRLLEYIFNESDYFQSQLKYSSNSTIIDVVYSDNLKNIIVPVIPIEEQKIIVSYLDSQCSKIDEAIAKQEQAVAKLEEYRKSIIYHAVTGKIDCRDI